MKKILFIVALVAALCLSTAAANGVVRLTDTDTVTVTGTTGYAELSFPYGLSFQFDDNLQPGEQLAVSWWIKNTGPCLLDVDVKVTTSGAAGPYVVVEFKPGYKFNIAQNVWKNVGLIVRLKQHFPDWKKSRSFTVTVLFNSTTVPERIQWPNLQGDK